MRLLYAVRTFFVMLSILGPWALCSFSCLDSADNLDCIVEFISEQPVLLSISLVVNKEV